MEYITHKESQEVTEVTVTEPKVITTERVDARFVSHYVPLTAQTLQSLNLTFIARYSGKLDELEDSFRKATTTTERTHYRYLIQRYHQLISQSSTLNQKGNPNVNRTQTPSNNHSNLLESQRVGIQ